MINIKVLLSCHCTIQLNSLSYGTLSGKFLFHCSIVSSFVFQFHDNVSGGRRKTQHIAPGVDPNDYPRLQWDTYDPQLIAEALFAIAKVKS